MFRAGTILNDTWEVRRRIGQGSFCELFLARNIVDKEAPMVAVKAQNSDIEASIIRVWVHSIAVLSIIVIDSIITAEGREITAQTHNVHNGDL